MRVSLNGAQEVEMDKDLSPAGIIQLGVGFWGPKTLLGAVELEVFTGLAKAYAALPKAGALIIYGSLIDDERRHNVFGLLMSLNMLIETKGGFDFTGADCTAWMREVGFRETYVEYLDGPDSMAVGIK